MADETERLDVDEAIEKLNTALRLQQRAVLEGVLAAGSLTGFQHVAIADRLGDALAAEVTDARRLVEKITALGGEPTTDVAEPRTSSHPAELVDRLIESETETIEALQDAIGPTGREGRSEALEHRLEHMIMRKQEAVDFLLRARGA